MGDPPPLAGYPPPKLHVTMWAALWSHVWVIVVEDPPGWLPPPHMIDGWCARPLRWLSVLVWFGAPCGNRKAGRDILPQSVQDAPVTTPNRYRVVRWHPSWIGRGGGFSKKKTQKNLRCQQCLPNSMQLFFLAAPHLTCILLRSFDPDFKIIFELQQQELIWRKPLLTRLRSVCHGLRTTNLVLWKSKLNNPTSHFIDVPVWTICFRWSFFFLRLEHFIVAAQHGTAIRQHWLNEQYDLMQRSSLFSSIWPNSSFGQSIANYGSNMNKQNHDTEAVLSSDSFIYK